MATSNGCAPAADIAAVSAGGTGAVAVSSPTVFQYPRQPAKDDGRMLALASLVGGFIDSILGGDSINDAQDAENKWKDLLDNVMKARGSSEMNRVDSERAKLPDFETDLKAQLSDYRSKADAMWPELSPLHTSIKAQITDHEARADSEWNLTGSLDGYLNSLATDVGTKSGAQWGELAPLDVQIHDAIDDNEARSEAELIKAGELCTDDAFTKLCQFVACGYTPDYAGVANRARADAELASLSAYEAACRTGNRYTMRRGQTALNDIRIGTVMAAVGATTAAREKERQFAFTTNHDMRMKHAQVLEQTRINRRELALKYDELALRTATERYNTHAKLSLDLQDRQRDITQARWGKHLDNAFRLDQAAVEMMRERWNSVAKIYLDLEGAGDRLSETQWRMFAESAFKSLREGGEMLAAAAQAYQFLAASIRATAKQGGGGTGGIAGALATLVTVLPMFSGSCAPTSILGIDFYPRPQECCGTTA